MVGGHTVDDAEPKYGMAVVGQVHPSQLLAKGEPDPGTWPTSPNRSARASCPQHTKAAIWTRREWLRP